MAVINVATKEIHAKVVYYGPGFSGKTTNLEYIYRRVPKESKGEMLSLATETERTLFFDFLSTSTLRRASNSTNGPASPFSMGPMGSSLSVTPSASACATMSIA
jgi:GTPase SAR1 family protein